MRKLIAGMKISVDGMMEGPDGTADWVDAWSDDYGVMPEVDACLLGGGMYPGYEHYWTSIREEPSKPAWITGAPPTPDEVKYAAACRRARGAALRHHLMPSPAHPQQVITREICMKNFLAVFTGTPEAMERSGWNALDEKVRQERTEAAMTA
jgi:hypothetical protein